jgi:hypothetical protein
MKTPFYKPNNKYRIWFRRLGMLGILFFLLKGLPGLLLAFMYLVEKMFLLKHAFLHDSCFLPMACSPHA